MDKSDISDMLFNISCVDLLVLPKLTILHTVNHLVLFSWVNSAFKLYLVWS